MFGSARVRAVVRSAAAAAGGICAVAGVRRVAARRSGVGARDRRFATLAAAASDAIVGVDARRRVDAWNAAAERTFGVPAAAAVGRAEVFDEIDPTGRIGELVERCFVEAVPVSADVDVDGDVEGGVGTRVVALTMSPVRGDDGAVLGAVGIGRDVTDRRRTAGLLDARHRELERSNESLERFAYAASHDLLEPLRMITSYTRLLAERYDEHLDEDGRAMVGFVADGTTRMQALVDDLLQLARLGGPARTATAVDPAHELDEARSLLAAAIHDLDARIDVERPLPAVLAHAGDVRQLWLNLVANSLKYRGDASPRIHVRAEPHGRGWARFVVSDEGIGLADDQLESIFEPFARLDTAPTDPAGSGIGLTLCRAIVTAYGGEIGASPSATGARFWFTLPRADATAGGDAGVSTAHGADTRRDAP